MKILLIGGPEHGKEYEHPEPDNYIFIVEPLESSMAAYRSGGADPDEFIKIKKHVYTLEQFVMFGHPAQVWTHESLVGERKNIDVQKVKGGLILELILNTLGKELLL